MTKIIFKGPKNSRAQFGETTLKPGESIELETEKIPKGCRNNPFYEICDGNENKNNTDGMLRVGTRIDAEPKKELDLKSEIGKDESQKSFKKSKKVKDE